MTSPAVFGNLVPWVVQVFLIASAGALLPLLLRIRHPRSQLVYYHITLALCLALPLIQPWQDSLLVVTGPAVTAHRSETLALPWGTVIAWVLLSGMIAKLCWLGVGLWQLRRYRRTATPVSPLPDSIRQAIRLTGADARFCISANVSGPATLGYIDPVVLLPESFASLDADAQRSIACHELLHVRRKDWLVTLIEEMVSAVFWFNPGVWWLLAQARLSREQLVDSEVVRLTAPEPYIRALLSMAVVSRRRFALPAAPFFTEGHLMRRMRLLLAGSNRSAIRICLSYLSVAALLGSAVWCASAWFPLMGEPQIVMAAVPRMADPRLFTIALPPPVGAREDVMYSVSHEAFVNVVPLDQNYSAMQVPPPPPPFPHLGPGGLLPGPGIRILRPGEIASPEEILHLQEAFGGDSEVEISQAEDGTVQRIVVRARRLPNEADAVRSRILSVPAESTSPTDRVD